MEKLIIDDKLACKIQFFYDHLRCQLGECQDLALLSHECDSRKTLAKVLERYERLATKFFDTFQDVVYDDKR